MAHVNDAAFTALRQLGYTGALPDMRYAYQRDIGVRLSSLYLQATGLPHVSDAALEFWSNPEYYPQPIVDLLFANGELGTFSDIRTYETSYFSDAGTTPANIGDPIYQINGQSGNGADWTQATEADRPTLEQDSSGLYLDFTGGKSISCTLPAGTYTLAIAGRDGLWFDSVVSAGGSFTVGAGSYTGGPANLIPSLGDKLVGPPLLLDRVLSSAERAAYVQWLQNRGASAFEIFALLIEDDSGYLLTEDDNVIYTEAA